MKISYVLTLQWRDGGNGDLQAGTYFGDADVPEGTSRTTLRNEVTAAAKRDMGVAGEAAILFLSIERNEF